MRNVPGGPRRLAPLVLALALAGLPAAPAAAQSDYCVPGNTHYDPADVPPGGSQQPPVAGVRLGSITVNGLRIPVRSSGPQNSREAVVFVHGNLGSSQDWLDLLPRVGALGRRAVAMDLPPYGHAPRPWELPYVIEDARPFFRDVLATLGITRAHMVLHDAGGANGLEWARARPRALISATLIDTGALIGYRHHNTAELWRSPAGEPFMAGLNRQVFSQGIQMGNEQRPLPQSYIDQVYDDFDRAARCATLKIYRGIESEEVDHLGRIQAEALRRSPRRPALVIWGRNDPYLPVEMAERQREAFPAAQVHVFDDSGHWPFVDNPERTRDLVIPFLRCVPTGKRDRIRLSVAPRQARAGRRTRFAFRTTVRRDGATRPVCGAAIRFGGRKAVSDGQGRAALRLTPQAGRRTATATKHGLRRGAAAVRIAPAR